MNVIALSQEANRILGICPCCGELFRLSEAQLFTRQAPPRTPFDKVDDEQRKLDAAVVRYDAKEQALKDTALAKGQAAARRQLRRVAGPFIQRKIDPQDVKVLFDPVEFIAFRGMAAGKVTKVVFIDRPATNKAREVVQTSMEKALKNGNYEWKVFRIGADGRVADGGLN